MINYITTTMHVRLLKNIKLYTLFKNDDEDKNTFYLVTENRYRWEPVLMWYNDHF